MRRAALAVAMMLAVAAPAAAADLQRDVTELLGRREGTIVVADPTSGRLLAVVNPGVAKAAYPPGSSFKLVTALAAIATGQAPLSRHFACDGTYRPLGPAPAGMSLHCWKPGGHGALTLEEALAHSCNVAFMQIGERTGIEAIRDAALRAGFTHVTADRRQTLQTAIGEGRGVAVTPLQMAGFVGAIATGGPLREPSWRPAHAAGSPIATASALARLRTGMRGSVLFGSSRQAGGGRVAIAGKTGTSTYLDGTNRTYGWFAGYAPADHPRVVVVVFLKHANGFASAAPLARQVVEAWNKACRP